MSVAASRTAEYMALFRALENLKPPRARICADPYAVGFLRPGLRLAASLSRAPLLGRCVPWLIDRRWPGARSSGVARTRLIDELVREALARGVAQVVILGAGYDCRAIRLPGLERCAVFELDQPATSRVKQARIRQMTGSLPRHVRFIEADLARQALAGLLERAGFSREAAAIFLWEGVTNYLTAAAVDATLEYVSRCAPGSVLVFTYVERGLLVDATRFESSAAVTALVRRIGERWTFGLDPDEVPDLLRARGFELIEDLDASEYRRRVMGAAAEAVKGYEFYHTATARVSGAPVSRPSGHGES